MYSVRMVCSRCNANMIVERVGNEIRATCPYCQNETVQLVESDPVRIAQMQADTHRMAMEMHYQVHRDRMDSENSLRRSRIVVIYVLALIVAGLITLYLHTA